MLIRQTRGEEPARLRELSEAVLIERESDGPPQLTSAELASKINNSTIITGEETDYETYT